MSSEKSTQAEPIAGNYRVVMRAPARLVIDAGNVITFNALSPSGQVNLRIFTNHVDEGHEVPVPRELVIEASGPAESLGRAVEDYHGVARPFTDILAFCANAHVGLLEPHLAWDDTSGRREREFMEVYLRDERGLPLTGRRLKLPETRAVLSLMSKLSDVEAASLVGVMSRYGVALSHWHLGGETASFTYLWFAVEALAKLIVSREVNLGNSPEQIANAHGMPRTGGVSVNKLEAFVRKNVVFKGQPDLHDEAFAVSNGLEHASIPLTEIHPRTAKLAPDVFSVLRLAILRFLDPDLSETTGLVEGLAALPLDTIQRRIVRGDFVNVADQLAHPDILYPVLEWRPRLVSLTRADNGDYNASFSDKMTVRCAPGVEFRAKSIEFRGRPDGSTGPPPGSVQLATESKDSSPDARTQVLGLLTQIQKAVNALGPGESGAEYSQPDAHLLEIFNMMRSSFRGCVQLTSMASPDEALILGRSVFRDAMRLREAASLDTNDRTALVFGWKLESIDALSEMVGDEEPDHSEPVSNRRLAIMRAAERFGVDEFRTFSPISVIAAQIGDDDYPQLDQIALALSNGCDLLSLSRRTKVDDQVIGLHDSAINDWAYPPVAKYVGGSYLLGGYAAMTLFNWADEGSAMAEATQELERLGTELGETPAVGTE